MALVRKFYGLVMLLCLLPLVLGAQHKPLSFEQVVPHEDFRENYFLSIFQDRDGYLWLGTYAALYRYNGYSTKSFVATNRANSLSNPTVHAIFQDKEGFIWFGTEGGLNRYDPKTEKFRRILTDSAGNSLSHPYIKSICQDKQGVLWLGTYGGGITCYDPATGLFKKYMHQPGNTKSLSSNRVNVVYADKRGDIWVGTELGGLCRYNRETDLFEVFLPDKTQPHTLSDDIVTALLEDKQGNLWIGTWRGGLNKLDLQTKQFSHFLTTEHKPGSTEKLTIRSIAADHEGNLWLGSFGNGLYHFNTQSYAFRAYTAKASEEQALSSNYIWSLFADKSGLLWIGTAGSGLNKYDRNRQKFPAYPLSVGEKFPVNGLLEDRSGDLWVCSDNGVLAKFDRQSRTYQYYLDKKISYPITSMAADRWGNIWLGGHEGLIRFRPSDNSYQLFSRFFKDQQANIMISALYCDKKGNLWVSLYDRGVYKIEAGQLNAPALDFRQFKEFRHDPAYSNSLSSNIVWDIKEDEAGYMWFATDKSLVWYKQDLNVFQRFGAFSFSCVYPESTHTIWAGTYGRGIAKIDLKHGTLSYLDETAGLSSNLVRAIAGDKKGNLWISTIRGLSVYNPRRKQFQRFDPSDGLQGMMFLHNAVASLSSGELAFGGTEGFNLFHPENIGSQGISAPVVIADIKLFNKSLSLDSVKYEQAVGALAVDKAAALRLDYKDNMFSIEFAALNFSRPEKLKFLYKLEGFDQDWVLTDASNRMATYTNLDGGTYDFVIKAVDERGNDSSPETRLSILVTPPLYKTWYFRLLLVLLSAGAMLFIYRKRLQFMEARYQKKQLETERELSRIKSEKLDAELSYKSKELTARTMNLIHKNEKIQEIKNVVLNTIPRAQGPVLSELRSLLKSIDNEIRDESHWDQFEFHFNETHDNFLKRFKEAYPVLTVNDLKVCAYIRMNLSNPEIAAILNISIRAVETSRYRIRKKIELNNQSINLTEYILKF